MSAAAHTTNNENVLTQKKGNHKGCPYDGLAGGYFLRKEYGTSARRMWRRDLTTYVLTAEMEQDEDGRWSAWIDSLPGCAAWGHTREEALLALQDAADAYIEDMEDVG